MSAAFPSRPDQPLSQQAAALLYHEAVDDGALLADTDDARDTPLVLLARSTIHVSHLTLLMAVLEGADAGDDCARVAADACLCSGALIRLGDAALLAHARGVGYDPGVWCAQAITQTASALSAGTSCGARDELPLAGIELRRATLALADAIAAAASDAMAIPHYLATALSGWLSCYVSARQHT
jgi:hypothetical protein